MTDCEHKHIKVEEHFEREYIKNVDCTQDEPHELDKILEIYGITESEYHAQYCPSGETNCYTYEFDEQIHWESYCYDCGEEIELMAMEGLNYTLYKESE